MTGNDFTCTESIRIIMSSSDEKRIITDQWVRTGWLGSTSCAYQGSENVSESFAQCRATCEFYAVKIYSKTKDGQFVVVGSFHPSDA